jgi:photosystem II stability/assembly factor-like uncharacterized protein
MMHLRPALICALVAAVLASTTACSSSAVDVDATAADAGGSPDAAPAPDAAPVPDAATAPDAETAPDAGAPDLGVVDSGPSYAEAVTAAQWRVLPNAPRLTRGKQDDVYFTNAQRGYAVNGPLNRIYRTLDGGDTWRRVYTSTGTYFRSLSFVDDLHGFAGNLGPIPGSRNTDTNVMYETQDGGDTWAPVTTISGPMPRGICNQTKIDAQNLIGVGRVTGPSHLIRSSDSGATWASTDLGQHFSMLIDARFTSPTEGIVIGGSAGADMRCTIFRTTDGTTFTNVFTGSASNSLCWKISFPTPLIGYVSIQNTQPGARSAIAKTTDGGQTWVELPVLDGPYSSIGVGFITADIGWLSSDNPAQPTLRTLDGGQTWTPDPILSSPINRFRFVDERTAYAIGGQIYKLDITWP